MATLSDRLQQNVPGKYYVDASCIDCDQCRTAAPQFFARDEDAGVSFVHCQPSTAEDCAQVEKVIGDCATSSIGNDGEGS